MAVTTTALANAPGTTASSADAISAQLSAAQATAAKDLAITAWAASTAPAETIAALSQVLHIGTVVDVCIDLPSTHSDGGAWIDRCQDKSWYTETLGGDRWIGRQATISAAWTAAGSATGAVYQASATSGAQTLGKFYTPNSSSTVTEVFRGIVPGYPRAGVAWIAESARVVVYDLGTGAMWMVFVAANAGNAVGGNNNIKCIAATNGFLVVGDGTYDAVIVSLMADTAIRTISSGMYQGSITLRNAAKGWGGPTYYSIVNRAVNSVAITTLENSPINPETGMPRPTIAVGTDGNATYSTSVIKHDGTVANIASDSTGTAVSVDFDGKSLKVVRSDGTVYIWNDVTNIVTGTAPDQTISASTIPALLGTVSKSTTRAKGSTLGMTLIKRNPAVPASSMVARVTERAPAFWQNGDIRFAGLADTVAETVTATTPLNETFATDVDAAGFAAQYPGWTAINSAVLSVVSNKLRITAGGTFYPMARKYITTVVGATYAVYIDVSGKSGDAATYLVNLHLAGGSTTSGSSTVIASLNAGTHTYTFVAIGTSTTVFLMSDGSTTGAADFDNISVRLADPDRSVKNAGMVVVGTLTKTAVASGAQLVFYGGSGVANQFSTTAYLTQPYSANHDYSTTGFCGALWLKEAPNSAIEYLLNRDSATPAQAIRLWVSVAGFLVFELYDGTTTRTATGTVAVDDSTLKLVIFDYLAGTLNIYVNDVLYATATGAALLTLNNAAAVLQVGLNVAGTLPATNASLALVRLSATVLSADQRSQLYRDELPLFQPGAQCTIAGTSPAVTALAYDDSTNILKVGTTYGVSSFKGLQRISSDTVAALGTTTVTSIASSGGMTVVGGSAGSNLYVPARYLRDELQRREEARKALGRVQVFFPFAAATSQVAFSIPAGYTTRAVYSAGSLKDLGSSLDYTVNTDGYKETVTFAVAPGNGVRVNVMAFRNY